MDNAYSWYSTLLKPSWEPPSWLFWPVWTVLYVLIACSFGVVLYLAYRKKIPQNVALPFVLNLVFNFAFTPLQFGLRNNILAFVDILLVLGTLIWAMSAIWRLPVTKKMNLRWIVFINIPYLLWVSFATVLQTTITILNF